MRVLFYLIFLALGGQLMAQTATQLKDIFPGEEDSSPTRFFQFGDQSLFRAETPDEGVELWITDGTPEGTVLLKDINTDPDLSRGNSNPDNFTEYKGKVYFKARASGTGDELWVTDGTPEGTVLLKDIQVGEGNGNPFDFIVYNDLLYFTANDGVVSSELWVTDGTEAGTRLVVDIQAGNAPGNPNFKTVFNNKLYFTANDGINGNEFWTSDGTVEGTMLVKDIRDGSNGSPSQYFVFNDLLYFRANNGEVGNELWVSDGTDVGTILLSDLRGGTGSSSPSDFFRVGDNLFFVANPGTGDDLFVITPETLLPVALGLNPDSESDPREITSLIEGQAYAFVADTSDADDGAVLYLLSSFGDEFDIEGQGYVFEELGAQDPDDLVWTGNSLYFSYETAGRGRELGTVSLVDRTDPLALGEIVAGSTGSSIDDIFLLGNRILFEADDTLTGRELWVLDVNTAYISLEADDATALSQGDTLDLGGVTLGFSSERSVTFRNTGTANSLLLQIEELGNLNEPFLVNFEGLVDDEVLPPAPDEAVASFSFTPTTNGEFLDSLTLVFLTGAGPGSVSFYLRGQTVAPALEVATAGTVLTSGETLTYTDVAERTDSTQTLVLTNTGEGMLIINGATLATGTVFNVPAVSDTLAAGSTFNLAVTYSPSDVSTTTDVLTLATNAGEFTVNLTGMSTINSIVDRGLPTQAVYPNPTNGPVRLELLSTLNDGNWRVVDVSGKVVSDGVWPAGGLAHDFDLSGFAPGIYQIEVTSGARRVVARVVRR
jgi:ELWxxDGT repeat protein